MASSPLHEPGEQYDARNSFLYFVLGLVSLSQNYLDRMGEARPVMDNAGADAPAEAGSPLERAGLLR